MKKTVELSPEEDLRMLEEYRESEVAGLMREKGIDEEMANRYFVVLETVRSFQARVAIMSNIPFNGITYNVSFDWESDENEVDPLRQYSYRVSTKTIQFDRNNWKFDEIGINGYNKAGTLAFSARVTYYAVPLGGDIHHHH